MVEINSNYEWILKIIRSSFNIYQFDSCENLIQGFKNLYPKHKNMGEVLSGVLSTKRKEHTEIF